MIPHEPDSMSAPSFKKRFKAWWEGYETADSPVRRATAQRPERPRLRLQCRFSPDVEVMHMIFGEGRSTPLPGNPFTGVELPASSRTDIQALLIGLETGGPAFHLNREHEFDVTALENNRGHLHAADELAREISGGGKLSLGPVDLANVELQQNRYDLIASRLVLHTLHGRDRFYQKIERALRKQGTLNLIQFCAADDADPDKVATGLKSHVEPEAATILRLGDERRLLIESGLRPNMIEDVSHDLTDQLTAAFSHWQELVERITGYDQQPRMLRALLALVEHWQGRISLMKSGDLQAVCFRSTKKPSELD